MIPKPFARVHGDATAPAHAPVDAASPREAAEHAPRLQAHR